MNYNKEIQNIEKGFRIIMEGKNISKEEIIKFKKIIEENAKSDKISNFIKVQNKEKHLYNVDVVLKAEILNSKYNMAEVLLNEKNFVIRLYPKNIFNENVITIFK